MTMLIARRGFRFQGSVLQRGDKIDPHDYPQITEDKWNQLKDPRAGHRFFDEIDPPGRRVASRADAELANARSVTLAAPKGEWVAAPVGADLERAGITMTPDVQAQGVPVVAPSGPTACPDCKFVAKNSHGLLVHRGRKH